ncbi:MAG: hypothetical protein EOM67_09785 [Spirochaetia bacterium]|nr:hypothetical protein [Spirochaetia bacterium]
MDFKEILEQWDSSSEGKKAAGDGRFSHIIEEKESSYEQLYQNQTKKARIRTGKSSLGYLKKLKDEAVLDLHGHTIEETKVLIEQFLINCVDNEYKKVRIIHGRGIHSQDGQGVLKQVVLDELRKSRYVKLYGNAPPDQGGSGATYVILVIR